MLGLWMVVILAERRVLCVQGLLKIKPNEVNMKYGIGQKLCCFKDLEDVCEVGDTFTVDSRTYTASWLEKYILASDDGAWAYIAIEGNTLEHFSAVTDDDAVLERLRASYSLHVQAHGRTGKSHGPGCMDNIPRCTTFPIQAMNAKLHVTVGDNATPYILAFLNECQDEIDPYAELKAAFADGKQIQVFAGKWSNVIADWTAPVDAYRIVDEHTECEDALKAGKIIQFYNNAYGAWCNCSALDFAVVRSPACTSNLKYRIRPDYLDWEFDRKVMVSMDGVKWTPAHFAGTNKHGAHLVYAQGKSMHTVVTIQKQTSQYTHIKDV